MQHQCKTFSLVFTVFENDLLRIIFTPKKFKIAVSWIILDNDGGYYVLFVITLHHSRSMS
jgi:hypothetical protein